MSLKDVCKQRIINDMVGCVSKPDEYLTMIVDEQTLRILSATCKTYDVLAHGVSLIELISRNRQSLKEMEAIYFISPNKNSLELFIKEFSDQKQKKYKCAHLFFSSPLTPEGELMQLLARSKTVLSSIKSFYDFNMEFIAYEQRIFHLDLPNSLSKLYPTNYLENSIVDKLITLFCSFNEKPYIRYHLTDKEIAKNLAFRFYHTLKNHSLNRSMKSKSQLIIIERSIDLAPLFLHEYTYQAFIYDVLNIKCATKGFFGIADDTYIYKYNSSKGNEEKEVIIGEHDDLWDKLRHEHLTVANQTVFDEAERFKQENPAALIQTQQNVSTEQASLAIRSLPQYRELLSKYSTHIKLCEQCLQFHKINNLNQIGLIEQDISCCVDQDGKELSVNKLLTNLIKFIQNNDISSDNKIRLISLFITQMTKIFDADLKKLIEVSDLSYQDENLINQILELNLQKSDLNTEQKAYHCLQKDTERIKYFKNKAKSSEFETNRYEPYLKEIIKKAVKNNLSKNEFPYIEEPPFSSAKSREDKFNGFQNSTQWEWGSSFDSTQSKNKKNLENNDKIIIFIIGDITFSETRIVYELSKSLKADIYLGGTAITSPTQFLDFLKSNRDKK